MKNLSNPETLKNRNEKEKEIPQKEDLSSSPAMDLLEEADSKQTPTFEEVFPNGIDSPELTEKNELIKDDPIRAPRNSAIELGNKYIQKLKEIGSLSSELIQKLGNQIQKVFAIEGIIEKDKGTNDPLLKELFPDKQTRTKWINENPQYKKHSRLAYLNSIKKIFEIGILDTFKEIDNFFKENKVDFPPMENVYTKDVMDFYNARIKDLSDFLLSPFENTSEKIKENSKTEREELSKSIAQNNSILATEDNETGRFETGKVTGKLNMEYFRKSLQDFSPENIEKHISDIKSGKLSETDKKILVDSIIRYIYENKESFSKDNYETIFSKFLNLANQIQNSEISAERSTETTIRYLNFIDGITKTKKIAKNLSPVASSPKFQTPLL